MKRRLDRLYNLVETTDMDIEDFKPRIRNHRARQQRLETAAEDARSMLSERRLVLDDVETITRHALEMGESQKGIGSKGHHVSSWTAFARCPIARAG